MNSVGNTRVCFGFFFLSQFGLLGGRKMKADSFRYTGKYIMKKKKKTPKGA